MKCPREYPRQRVYRIAYRVMCHAIRMPSMRRYRRWMDTFFAISAREGL